MKNNNYSKTIRYLYYILFFIVPFVVLPVNSELFEFNKMIFIYIISTLILGVWLLRCFNEKKILVKRTPFDIPLGIFFISQAVSTIFSIDFHTSLFGFYGRFNGGLLSTAVYIFLYYGFMSNFDRERNKIIRVIFMISIAASVAVVLWGLPGKFNRDLSCLLFTSKFDNSCWTTQFRPAERMFSTLGQPNWLGSYLAITFFMSLFVLFTSQSKKMRFFALSGTLFAYAGILLSRSRSSMSSLVPGVAFIGIYFIILFFKKNDWISHVRKIQIVTVIMGLFLVTIVAQTGIPKIDSLFTLSHFNKPAPVPRQPTAPEPVKSLQVIGEVTESLDIRKIVWKGAWELGMQYPLFGTGVETFGYSYYSVRPRAHNLTSEWDYLYNKAHNEYLNFLATTGWFGLGSVVLLLIWIGLVLIKSMYQNKADHDAVLYYLALAGIFTSICVTNFFGFSITVINLYWYIGLALLALFNHPDEKGPVKSQKVSLSLIGMVVILVLWLLNSIGTYWFADYRYAQSEIAQKSNDAGASVNLLQEALSLREEHVYEDKLSYALAQYSYTLAYQKEQEKAREMIYEADKLNLKTLQASPQNVLYWKTRVKNQFIFYQMFLDKKFLFTGIAALDEATKLAPTDPKIPYFSATYYSLLYDDEKDAKQKELYMKKSYRAIEDAISLKSDYGDAYYLKVQLLKKYGEKEKARKLLEWYVPRYAPTNEDLKKEIASP